MCAGVPQTVCRMSECILCGDGSLMHRHLLSSVHRFGERCGGLEGGTYILFLALSGRTVDGLARSEATIQSDRVGGQGKPTSSVYLPLFSVRPRFEPRPDLVVWAAQCRRKPLPICGTGAAIGGGCHPQTAMPPAAGVPPVRDPALPGSSVGGQLPGGCLPLLSGECPCSISATFWVEYHSYCTVCMYQTMTIFPVQ